MNGWTGGTNVVDSSIALVDRDQVGTVWGLAYQNVTDRLFAASLLRRYTPALATDLQNDTIFLIDNNRDADPNKVPGTSTLLGQISLSTLGIDTGDAITRTLSDNDAAAFALVGKRGIGGIDLATSGYNSTLYLANLTDRNVYGLKVGVPATTTLSAADVVELPAAPWITGDPCNGLGPARPWAVKVYEDNLYVGLVCTGENAPNRVVYINAGSGSSYRLTTDNNNPTASASDGWSPDTGLYTFTNSGVVPVQVSMGGRHGCMVDTGGGVQCWGQNDAGHLGTGNTTDFSSPVQVTGLTSGTVMVKASVNNGTNTFDSTCALLANGTVRCWGDNSSGQLGRGNTTDSNTPVQVETSAGVPLTNVTQIAVGNQFACAISSGDLYCWGENGEYQIGNNSTTDQTRPLKILTGGVTWVGTGRYHACAVQNGALKCWGDNNFGRLGNGLTTGDTTTPAQVIASGVVQVDAGEINTCVLLSDSTVKCAGYGDYAAIGNGTTSGNQSTFVNVQVASDSSNLTGATAIAVGGANACALMSDTRVMCWGRWTAMPTSSRGAHRSMC